MSRQFLSKENAGIIAAFGAVYILWGSTYLGIKYAIETIPPFIMAGSRFLIAGSILCVWALRKGSVKLTWADLKQFAIISILLLVIGNGGVVIAEKYIASGMTALLITIEPVWVVLIQMAKGKKPDIKVWIGMILGFTGMFILIGPSGIGGLEQVNLFGFLLIMISTFSWAAGSVYSSGQSRNISPLLSTGIQMLIAGVIFSSTAWGVGEYQTFELSKVSTNSMLALIYLIVCGSLIGFTCYIWLIKASTPGKVSTYAYINPVIAVILGIYIGGETVNSQILIATPILVLAVILILLQKEIKFPEKGRIRILEITRIKKKCA
ncbi:MAG: EamA family transporter [Cytophagaceae bacterium]